MSTNPQLFFPSEISYTNAEDSISKERGFCKVLRLFTTDNNRDQAVLTSA